jgi:hypothetical protein
MDFARALYATFAELMHEWPAETKDSNKARAARQACLAALEGVGETEDARQAFRAAAKEAGIFIGDVDRVPPKGHETQAIGSTASRYFWNVHT